MSKEAESKTGFTPGPWGWYPHLPDPRDAEIARLRDALAYTIGALRVVSAETKTDPQLLHLYGIAQAAIDLATLGPEGCSDCDAAIARARGENP